MMRALLWKEWHERRYWLLLFALAEVGAGFFASAQSPFRWGQNASPWILLPVALALLAGLGTYGSELTGGRATFLYSRALCWKQVLLAKVLLGVSVLVAAPVLTALMLPRYVPAPYLPFMTPANLLLGALWVILLTGTAFFIGLGCSIVLAGLAGSILVLLGYLGLFLLISTLYQHLPGNPMLIHSIGFCCAPLLAAVVIARFGITLSPGARLRRFALVLFFPVVAGCLLELLPQARTFGEDPAQTAYNFTPIMSPSGVYAYAVCLGKDAKWLKVPFEFYACGLWSVKDANQPNYWVSIANKRCILPPTDPVSLKQYFIGWSTE